MVNEALGSMHDHFSALYAPCGRPSIAPEYLLRASLLQVFYTIRSERLLMEQLEYNLLFRWFVGISMDDPAWNHSVFSKNRECLLNTEVAAHFFKAIGEQARQRDLMSADHFSVDGTLLEAWASMKRFRPKDGSDKPDSGRGRNPDVDFRGQQRKNDTHASTTDPDARLYKKAKGDAAKLRCMGHALMENRNGLVVNTRVTVANGTAERDTAVSLLEEVPGRHRVTVGADKGYDAAGFVRRCRERVVTPHVTQKKRGSAIDGRTTRHEGYRLSLKVRKRVEEVFGWLKTIAGLEKLHHERVDAVFILAAWAYNLIRIRNLTTTS